METLNLSDSTPRSESRLKSLFWPSIQNGADVDYLGTQGYWVCTLLAIVSFIFSLISGEPVVGAAMLLFYYLGGVGVRERSRYAAAIILSLYVADTMASGLSVVRVIFAALLISNLRATWIASTWKPDSEEAIMPTRLNQTWGDKFSDQFPSWLWPKVRAAYYVFSICVVTLFAIGITMLIRRSTHPMREDVKRKHFSTPLGDLDRCLHPDPFFFVERILV